MAKFHKLKVADVCKETTDCVSIAFELPASLREEYKYIQGQYLTLKLNINGEEVRRSYSVCSSPVVDNELRVAIKRVKDGRASTYLTKSIKVGDTIEVMTPMGNFFSSLDPSVAKNYILFAGGSGITPMLSIIKTVLQAEPLSKITLFYGNLDEASTIFKKQLDTIRERNLGRFNLYYIYDKPTLLGEDIFQGIMSPEKVKKLIERFVNINENNEYFICGPGPMMDSVKQTLHHLNIDNSKIHIEYFTAATDASPKPNIDLDRIPLLQSQVTIIIDGVESTITVPSDGNAILDAALDADLDVPFACKGAVCCTCRAKLVEGQVRMDMNYALSDSEVAQGYILTCQAHPLTPIVVVDYDHN